LQKKNLKLSDKSAIIPLATDHLAICAERAADRGKMNTRYRHEALDFLADVADYGAGRLTYNRLYRWFDADRLTNKRWGELADLFQEVLTERGEGQEGWRLGMIDFGRTDEIVLVCMDPEGTDEPSIKPVTARA
jgi:hypothetical protein